MPRKGMVDEEKIRKPWNDDELDAIVADYFSMLRAELSRQQYVKAHHSAVLMQQIGRTHRSVEFKHQKHISRFGRNGTALDRRLQTEKKLSGVDFWRN
jgi:hypothetical protein